VNEIDIEAALSEADPKLGKVIKAVASRIGRQRIPDSRSSPFEALVRAIVYQSVSAKAAAAIYERLRLLKGTSTPAAVYKLISSDSSRAIRNRRPLSPSSVENAIR
jgi:3-methyladenine DNA glycosylase/8-oxoguanine DNA glycosylase